MTDNIVIHHRPRSSNGLIAVLIVIMLLMGLGILELSFAVSGDSKQIATLGGKLDNLQGQLDATNADNARKDQVIAQKDARIRQLTDQLLRAGLTPTPAATIPVVVVPGPSPTPRTTSSPQPAGPSPKPSPSPRPSPTSSPRPTPSPSPTPCLLPIAGRCVLPR